MLSIDIVGAVPCTNTSHDITTENTKGRKKKKLIYWKCHLNFSMQLDQDNQLNWIRTA